MSLVNIFIKSIQLIVTNNKIHILYKYMKVDSSIMFKTWISAFVDKILLKFKMNVQFLIDATNLFVNMQRVFSFTCFPFFTF